MASVPQHTPPERRLAGATLVPARTWALRPCGQEAGLCQAACRPGTPRFPNAPASQRSDIRCPGSLGASVPAGLGGHRRPGCGEGLGCGLSFLHELTSFPTSSQAHGQPLAPIPHPLGRSRARQPPRAQPSAWPLGSRPCCGKEQRVPQYASCPHPFPFPQRGPNNQDGHGERVDRAHWSGRGARGGSAQAGQSLARG